MFSSQHILWCVCPKQKAIEIYTHETNSQYTTHTYTYSHTQITASMNNMFSVKVFFYVFWQIHNDDFLRIIFIKNIHLPHSHCLLTQHCCIYNEDLIKRQSLL